MVGRIATGEIVEAEKKPSAAVELGRKGGKARVESITATATLADKRYAYIVWGVRDADHVVVVCCP